MVKIVILGHDVFASSIKSVLEFIAGTQSEISYIDFKRNTSPDALNLLLKKEITDAERIVFFCDLPGGTPYKEAVAVAKENSNCSVVAGCNISSLLDYIFSDKTKPTDQIADQMVTISKNTTLKFDMNGEYQVDFI